MVMLQEGKTKERQTKLQQLQCEEQGQEEYHVKDRVTRLKI
jgi:hypothetical protein